MRLLLLTLLLLPLPANAFELTLGNGDRVIVDESNIFRVDDGVTFYQSHIKRDRIVKTTNSASCKTKFVQIVDFHLHDRDGNLLSTVLKDQKPVKIVPNTVGWEILRRVCESENYHDPVNFFLNEF